MKNNLKHFTILFLIAAAIFNLSSCYPSSQLADPYIIPESRQKENLYYVPSVLNTPLNFKKGDLDFSVMSTSNSKLSGGEAQASYMPGKHLGIMASYSFAGSIGSNPDNIHYNRFELGSGMVTQLSKNIHFNTYGGFGLGTIMNTHATGSSKINLTHFFLQPAIVISDKRKNIQLGFVSKFSGVNFKVMDTSFKTDREPFSTTQLKSLYNQPFHIVWEPGVVFRAGWKNFQFHTGYSFSADITNPDLYRANGNFSLGVCLRLNTLDFTKVKFK
ncbi:MAG: hypothetical protein JWN76_265 [Chitinophagaceae bacterium]|nr:hypothetical protein [Chitinophagaceae bacterium]